MNSRNTEQADRNFSAAVLNGNANANPEIYQVTMAMGLKYCALALRDIYDKLSEMDKKVDALMGRRAA